MTCEQLLNLLHVSFVVVVLSKSYSVKLEKCSFLSHENEFRFDWKRKFNHHMILIPSFFKNMYNVSAFPMSVLGPCKSDPTPTQKHCTFC